MSKKKIDGKFIHTILPYLVFGISIAVIVSLAILFFYLFVWGIIIGFVLWGIATLKEKFFPSPKVSTKKERSHTVLHVEEDGSVVIEEESEHKKTHRGKK